MRSGTARGHVRRSWAWGDTSHWVGEDRGGLNPEQTGGRMLDFLCHCDPPFVAQSTIKVGVRYLEIKDMQFTIAMNIVVKPMRPQEENTQLIKKEV